MMTTLCFNSVPMELVADSTGDSKLTPKVMKKIKNLSLFHNILTKTFLSGKGYNFD